MSARFTPAGAARPSLRCRRRRPIDPASPRPGELLRAFFLAALLFIAAAGAAAIAYSISGEEWLHWLALHLLLLGGISQLVLGAGQFFTCAFLATDPPSRRLISAQLAAWNTGTLLVGVAVPTNTALLAEAGGALIATGLALFAVALRRMKRRSLQHAPWALRWYLTSAAFLGLGGLIGILMARGTPWSHGSALHTFFPSLTQTQLPHPRLQRATHILWTLGVLELTTGAAFSSQGLLVAGWTDLMGAALLLGTNVWASLRAAPRPLTLPARLLALAQVFLFSGLVLAAANTVTAGVNAPFTGTTRAILAVLLLAGWIGLTVAGSLLHLLAILARIRHSTAPMPTPRPARERALTAAAGLAVATLALSKTVSTPSLGLPVTWLTLTVAALLAARVIALAVRALATRRAPST